MVAHKTLQNIIFHPFNCILNRMSPLSVTLYYIGDYIAITAIAITAI